MKWFGPKSWRAPICTPEDRVEIPVGSKCYSSGKVITAKDSGFVVPHHGETTTEEPWLFEEFMRSIITGYKHETGPVS